MPPHYPDTDRVSRSSSLPTEMSIPVTLISVVLVGAATLTVARSRAGASRAASAGAMSLYPRELPESCPQLSSRLIPTSASGTFCLAVASIAAHDVFIPLPNVRVTADDRARRGRTTFLFACTGPPFRGMARTPTPWQHLVSPCLSSFS